MTNSSPLGSLLETACAKAEKDIVLIAPFIKYRVIKRLIACAHKFEKLVVVARWRPADIAVGVSDIEVFDFLRDIENSELRIYGLLHAKYYRFDNQVFIGSANLTNAGLGWGSPANVETLISLPDDMYEKLQELEQQVLSQSSLVTDEMAKAIIEASTKVATMYPESLVESEERIWLPSCIRPEEMFSIIIGKDVRVTQFAHDAALRDIAALGLSICPDEKEFKEMAKSLLLSEKIFVDIRKIIEADKLTDKGAITFLSETYKSYFEISPDEQWKILKAWIKYFMSDDFHIIPIEEAIEPGRIISSNSD